MEEISIDKIITDEKKIKSNSEELKKDYHLSYKEFIKYFSNLKKITKHNYIIGINFTYGWMPTIFHFKNCVSKNKIDEIVKILNNVKDGITISKQDIEYLVKVNNNSLVGTSKLLHFINPNNYIILDSRVYYYVNNGKVNYYQLNKVENYLQFLNNCKQIINDNRFKEVYESMIKKVGYKISSYRALELIMFINSKLNK